MFTSIPQAKLTKLIEQAAGSGIHPVEPIAAAIIHLQYRGAFALVPSEVKTIQLEIEKTTIPVDATLILGSGIERRTFQGKKIRPRDMLPLAVLHRSLADAPSSFGATLRKAVDHCTDPTIDLRWVKSEGPPAVFHAAVGLDALSRVPANDLVLRANREVSDARTKAKDAKDPAMNGKPESVFDLPRPELQNSFAWWCLQLGFMLSSPHIDKPRYVAVIDQIADHCIRLMPQAHAQDREERRVRITADGRYAVRENKSLPKYVRWLLKRHLPDRAIQICELALSHSISPNSPGAFERSLAAALKSSHRKPR